MAPGAAGSARTAEADALLADGSESGAAFRTTVGSPVARVACASAALAAALAFGVTLFSLRHIGAVPPSWSSALGMKEERHCNSILGKDVMGQVIETLPGISFPTCQRLCFTSGRCGCYAWDQVRGRTCWLKGGACTQFYKWDESSDMVSGKCTGPVPAPPNTTTAAPPVPSPTQAPAEATVPGTALGRARVSNSSRGDDGVAVLLAGTLVRYFPNLDEHVVAPLGRRGTVDVYLSLSVEGFTSWRKDGDEFVMHPAYQSKTLDEVKDMIAEGIRDHGGNAAVIRMPTSVPLTEKGHEFRVFGEWWSTDWSTGKGVFNLDHGKATRTNVAKLYLELSELWNIAKMNEVEAKKTYGHVMIFRDDSNWLREFDLDRLLRTGGHPKLDGGASPAGRAFVQGCWPRDSHNLCDYVVVAQRSVAEPFGSFYFLMTDPGSMGVGLDPKQVKGTEAYFYRVAQAFGIRVEEVPSDLIPLVRCGRLSPSGSIVVCRHKRLCDNSIQGVPTECPGFTGR